MLAPKIYSVTFFQISPYEALSKEVKFACQIWLSKKPIILPESLDSNASSSLSSSPNGSMLGKDILKWLRNGLTNKGNIRSLPYFRVKHCEQKHLWKEKKENKKKKRSPWLFYSGFFSCPIYRQLSSSFAFKSSVCFISNQNVVIVAMLEPLRRQKKPLKMSEIPHVFIYDFLNI